MSESESKTKPPWQDPTREEIDNFIKNKPAFKEFDKIDIEAAIYWFASGYYVGQSSNLYSVLSTLKYKPAFFEVGPEGAAWYVFCELEERFAPCE